MIQYFPIVTGSLTVLGNINVSGSITTSGSITISGSITSASFASTASFVALAQSASNAVSAATASFANTLTVAGNLTAQTLVVQTITSSVDFVTGSTRFGSISANTHVFTGSLFVSGSTHSILGKLSIGTGSNYPETTFDVVGYNAFRENSSSAHSWFPYTNGSAYVSCRTGSSIYFREYHDSSNTVFMTITGSRVGIGTTNPSQRLQVYNSSNGTSAAFGGTTYGIRIDNGGTYSSGRSTIFGVDNTFFSSYQPLALGASTIYFNIAGTDRVTIDSNGTVIKSNQPAFQVTRGTSGNQLITSGVDTVLQFNTVRFDTQSNFNTSTYRFVAPVAGRYQFNSTVRYDVTTAGGYLRTYFAVNGTGAGYTYGHMIMGPGGFSTSYQGMSISAVIQLAAGDYVQVFGGHTTQTEFHQESQFSGYLLG